MLPFSLPLGGLVEWALLTYVFGPRVEREVKNYLGSKSG